jgi:6-phosphogluconolactonase
VNVQTFDDPQSVAEAAAALVAQAIRGGVRSLVLAGGSTPAHAYELLSEMPLEWGRVAILFGDERCVPPDHPDSNYLMARRSLLDRVSPGSVHRMAGELGPDTAAALYEPIVRWLGPLDLVLLGMGPDGHTASLFPGHREVSAEGMVVGVRGAPKPPPERVSLTLGCLRQARRVVIIVTGADKAAALAAAARGEVPAGMIANAEYLVDRAAASQLGAPQPLGPRPDPPPPEGRE